ncbi:MAG: nicotinate (nicotinamide) nucleotide adenylyltransferase [Planctomycetota bacterium]
MVSGAAGSTDDGTPASNRGIGIYGGSFNPPHQSHVRLCRAALQHLPIDRLHVVVSGDHPHKRGRPDLVSAEHRLAMARLAMRDVPGVVVDDRELHRQGPSYTSDTLEEFAQQHPGRELFFLIGSDNLPLLPTWHAHHRMLELATVTTYPRAGDPIDPAQLAALDLTADECRHLLANVLDLPADDTSSSELRRQLAQGCEPLEDVPAPVRIYIDEHALYR